MDVGIQVLQQDLTLFVHAAGLADLGLEFFELFAQFQIVHGRFLRFGMVNLF